MMVSKQVVAPPVVVFAKYARDPGSHSAFQQGNMLFATADVHTGLRAAHIYAAYARDILKDFWQSWYIKMQNNTKRLKQSAFCVLLIWWQET
jgi:hypothetical protein